MVNEPRNRELYRSNFVAIQKFQAAGFSIEFVEVTNQKFSAYREFTINAGYQGKKPQGRASSNRSSFADLRSPRYIFARLQFRPESQPRLSATCIRSALADVYVVTDRGICEASGNSPSNTPTAA